MGLIIVPEEYYHLPRNLAPICIEDHDAAGEPINLEWIDRGVRPIHGRLCHLTERIVGDQWAVSEVAGNAVHSLWLEYGDSLGSDPARQVQARAEWEAQDIRFGGWRLRKGRERYLDDLDEAIRAAISHDPRDCGQLYEMRLDMQALARTEDRVLNSACRTTELSQSRAKRQSLYARDPRYQATRSARLEIVQNEDWEHIIHCSPCYAEYLEITNEIRGAKDRKR